MDRYRGATAKSVLAIMLIASPIPVIGAMRGLAAESATPAERNPPGDIPDTQVFIDYVSPDGFTLKVPEGWARTDRPDGANFVDKLDGVVVSSAQESAAPTVAGAKSTYVPKLEAQQHAVRVTSVKTVTLPAGDAIRIIYTSN